jgi:hypothetical protein
MGSRHCNTMAARVHGARASKQELQPVLLKGTVQKLRDVGNSVFEYKLVLLLRQVVYCARARTSSIEDVKAVEEDGVIRLAVELQVPRQSCST